MRTALCTPRCLLPRRHQKKELSRRPPSSGNAGTRLKRARATLTNASQPSRSATSAGEGSSDRRKASSATARLVSGPTPAITASAPALLGSPSSLETPPKSHSVIPPTLTPLRRATSGWASWLAGPEGGRTSVAAVRRTAAKPKTRLHCTPPSPPKIRPSRIEEAISSSGVPGHEQHRSLGVEHDLVAQAAEPPLRHLYP